ncbi:Uma2 family endonuclease [Silvibacterium dinghuense]|uniref:Uma2 family endonuclease n=1 Tax=Silvibacterium dinghuense TaxID=1560006 RepID=A0A4Q1SKK2_9BACT|nr:Uma2 family endonuclease [Silvibacterium dinghuense]
MREDWADTGGVSAIPQPVKVPVAEYLASSYRPDCDYVDGVIEERNLGEKEHSILQGAFYFLFHSNRKQWQTEVYPELRVQVSATRFRIPDITVTRSGLKWERILREAPLLCIEILSPEDTMARIRQRVDDYLAMGTEHVWVVDPELRKGYVCSSRGFEEPENGVLAIPGSEIQVVLSELFAELDRA